MATCREVMTADPVCCLGITTVDQAAQMMRDEEVGPIPVVENFQTHKLIGIITDRDLTLKVLAEGRDPSTTRVQEVMTQDVATCKPDDDLQKAMGAMAAHQVRRIPVVDENGSIVGIVAQADIATRVENPVKTAEVVEAISKPA